MAKLAKKSWQPLKRGDLVDIVAPGFAAGEQDISGAIHFLEEMGLRARVPDDLFGDDVVCSNTDKIRFKHLKKAFQANDSKAVWCIRGGYGAIRLIEEFAKLKKPTQNKLFIGYSDATTLHNFLNQFWGFSSLHGPLLDRLGQKNLAHEQISEITDVIFGRQAEVIFKNLKALNSSARSKKIIQSSLAGGNLAVTQTHLGTKFSKEPKGQILFFEDTGERGYKVDKMLKQLEMSGYFKSVQAVVFGEFLGGREENGETKIPAVLERFACQMDIPVFSGVEVGHGQYQRALPLGTLAELKCGSSAQLKISVPLV